MEDFVDGIEKIKKQAVSMTPTHADVQEKGIAIATQLAWAMGKAGADYTALPRGYGVIHEDPMGHRGRYMLIRWPEGPESPPIVLAGTMPTANHIMAFIDDLDDGLMDEFYDFLLELNSKLEHTQARLVWNLPALPGTIPNKVALDAMLEEKPAEQPSLILDQETLGRLTGKTLKPEDRQSSHQPRQDN